MSFIRSVFASRSQSKQPVFVGFAMEGFPSREATVDVLLNLERGGADVIELAVPHSDPIADGATLQRVANVSLANKASAATSLSTLREARSRGLKCPVVFFGYFNTFRAYGIERFTQDAAQAGADALLCVDLPIDEWANYTALHLPLVPLITPTTTSERMKEIAALPNVPFIYCVALLGVTGARDQIPAELPEYVKRATDAMGPNRPPLVVGFGISSRSMFEQVASLADGVVVASAMLDKMLASKGAEAAVALEMSRELTGRSASLGFPDRAAAGANVPVVVSSALARTEANGWYGEFGGSYIPETLRFAVDELAAAFEKARNDASFWEEVRALDSFVGRPTPLHLAANIKGGAKIWLKREDLAHTGAHKINNALGQALLTKRLGKRRVIAETGAGQHGVAVATACAKLGLECVVYMGAVDVERQSLNVYRMKSMGAKVVPVESGTRTLKDAVNEAMRAWVTNVRDTHYILGSAVGPHPFPLIVREFQRVIGREARSQFRALNGGALPDVVMACVGGGSNAIGMFSDFVPDASVELIGVEAAGAGVETGQHCAPLSFGTPGVLHGTMSMLMQDSEGQVLETHSVSAGLDYPGVGPEHAHLLKSGRAKYTAATDKEALDAFEFLCRTEGIIPALESSHALAAALKLAKQRPESQSILICLSGRGDKDINQVAKIKGVNL